MHTFEPNRRVATSILDVEQRAEGYGRTPLERNPDTRVIVTTALAADQPGVVHATGLGTFRYLGKPLRFGHVRAVIKDVDAEHLGGDEVVGRLPGWTTGGRP